MTEAKRRANKKYKQDNFALGNCARCTRKVRTDPVTKKRRWLCGTHEAMNRDYARKWRERHGTKPRPRKPVAAAVVAPPGCPCGKNRPMTGRDLCWICYRDALAE